MVKAKVVSVRNDDLGAPVIVTLQPDSADSARDLLQILRVLETVCVAEVAADGAETPVVDAEAPVRAPAVPEAAAAEIVVPAATETPPELPQKRKRGRPKKKKTKNIPKTPAELDDREIKGIIAQAKCASRDSDLFFPLIQMVQLAFGVSPTGIAAVRGEMTQAAFISKLKTRKGIEEIVRAALKKGGSVIASGPPVVTLPTPKPRDGNQDEARHQTVQVNKGTGPQNPSANMGLMNDQSTPDLS